MEKKSWNPTLSNQEIHKKNATENDNNNITSVPAHHKKKNKHTHKRNKHTAINTQQRQKLITTWNTGKIRGRETHLSCGGMDLSVVASNHVGIQAVLSTYLQVGREKSG